MHQVLITRIEVTGFVNLYCSAEDHDGLLKALHAPDGFDHDNLRLHFRPADKPLPTYDDRPVVEVKWNRYYTDDTIRKFVDFYLPEGDYRFYCEGWGKPPIPRQDPLKRLLNRDKRSLREGLFWMSGTFARIGQRSLSNGQVTEEGEFVCVPTVLLQDCKLATGETFDHIWVDWNARFAEFKVGDRLTGLACSCTYERKDKSLDKGAYLIWLQPKTYNPQPFPRNAPATAEDAIAMMHQVNVPPEFKLLEEVDWQVEDREIAFLYRNAEDTVKTLTNLASKGVNCYPPNSQYALDYWVQMFDLEWLTVTYLRDRHIIALLNIAKAMNGTPYWVSEPMATYLVP